MTKLNDQTEDIAFAAQEFTRSVMQHSFMPGNYYTQSIRSGVFSYVGGRHFEALEEDAENSEMYKIYLNFALRLVTY